MDRYREHRLKDEWESLGNRALTVASFGLKAGGVITSAGLLAGGAFLTYLNIAEPAAFQTLMGNISGGFNSHSDFSEVVDDPNAEAIANSVRVEPIILPPIIKDPVGGHIVPQHANSVGVEDERVTAYVHQTVFDPVGELANGCTATYVEIPDYQVMYNDYLLVTAPHCVVDEGGDIIFHGNYGVDDNGNTRMQRYSAVANEIWIHPFYSAFRDATNAQDGNYTPYDIALLRVDRDKIPVNIEPAELNVVDFSRLNINELLATSVSSLGYSADRAGLSYHQNCRVTEASFRDFQTDCDIAGGASGGNVTLPFDVNGDDRLRVFAINGGTLSGTEFARHSFFERNILSTIPFVVPIEGDDLAVCARVDLTSGNLNRRFEPSINGALLSAEEGSYYGGLPDETLVQVFGSINGWDFIQPIADGDVEPVDRLFGYSSAQFLTPVQCPASLTY